jgi:hypothetical protein
MPKLSREQAVADAIAEHLYGDDETWSAAARAAIEAYDKWTAEMVNELVQPRVGERAVSPELDALIDRELANKPKDIMR